MAIIKANRSDNRERKDTRAKLHFLADTNHRFSFSGGPLVLTGVTQLSVGVYEEEHCLGTLQLTGICFGMQKRKSQ